MRPGLYPFWYSLFISRLYEALKSKGLRHTMRYRPLGGETLDGFADSIQAASQMTEAGVFNRKQWFAGLILLVLGVSSGYQTDALAQAAWPGKPIRVIVPSALGGSGDVATRLISARVLAELKQPLLADPRPGAGGMIGLRMAAQAAPDGYTFVMGNPGPVAVVPHTEPDVGYDILADFDPVSMLMTIPIVLSVRDDVPAKNLSELIALIRSKPGSINFGSSGVGQSPHMAAELFQKMIGVDFVISPYKGAAPAVNDLLVGSIQAMFDSTTALPMVRQGRLRALAIAGRGRSTLMPAIPTMIEQGFPGFEISSWYVLLAPARTPQPIIRRFNKLVADTLNTPETRQQLATINAEALPGTPEDAREFVRSELANWGNIVKRIRNQPK